MGIPTVADRIAQTVIKQVLEPELEKHFHPGSFGYRPGRSAHQALSMTRKRCWTYQWVLEFDIKGYFDNIDHGLLMRAVQKHTQEKWVLLYIERWLKAPVQMTDGTLQPRDRGTPQGGVASPLLANLFLHYTFDVWMQKHYPEIPFERYADDGVLHCRSKEQAVYLGRKDSKKDPVLRGKADYILEAGGEVRWVIEGKAPSCAIDADEIEQAWTYANHPEVRAVYFSLCNGKRLSVYQTNRGAESPPILSIN